MGLTDFRFANPTNPYQTNFNNTIGLGGQGNVNKAYSAYFQQNPNALQDFQSAWGYDADGNLQNGDLAHSIINTYTPGGGGTENGLLGQGYGLDPSQTYMNPEVRRAGAAATRAQVAGQPLNNFYGGASGGTPLSQVASNTSAPAANTSSLPGVGSGTYSDPLTDVSAYLDPSMAWQLKQGTNAIQNSAAAGGSLQSGQTLKDLTSYAQGLASTDYSNAFNRAMQDTNRRYGVDSNDRQFAYNAATGDRDFNANNDYRLAQLGLSGAQGSSSLASTLAALLSGNAASQGQAQGAGTIGSNNSLKNMLSQIMGQYNSNNWLSLLNQMGYGTGG